MMEKKSGSFRRKNSLNNKFLEGDILMKEIRCDGALYCLGFIDKTDESFSKSEWVINENISAELVRSIIKNKYKVVFLKESNIFSHEMNVLRKAIKINNTKLVIGAQALYPLLSESEFVTIDVKFQKIIIDGKVYQFKKYNYFAESSELLEFDINDCSVCYKPDYYYCEELASIVSAGFTKAGVELVENKHFYSEYKQDGRVWCIEGLFPSELTENLIQNPTVYFENIDLYVTILEKIYGFAMQTNDSQNLRELLINHYKYSLLFSFSIPYLAKLVIEKEGVTKMEEIYSIFVKNSPIADKEQMIFGVFYNRSKGMNDIMKTGFLDEHIIENDFSTYDLLLFVANMISDMRRCVINLLIEHDKWFESICGHRKKSRIF